MNVEIFKEGQFVHWKYEGEWSSTDCYGQVQTDPYKDQYGFLVVDILTFDDWKLHTITEKSKSSVIIVSKDEVLRKCKINLNKLECEYLEKCGPEQRIIDFLNR